MTGNTKVSKRDTESEGFARLNGYKGVCTVRLEGYTEVSARVTSS